MNNQEYKTMNQGLSINSRRVCINVFKFLKVQQTLRGEGTKSRILSFNARPLKMKCQCSLNTRPNPTPFPSDHTPS